MSSKTQKITKKSNKSDASKPPSKAESESNMAALSKEAGLDQAEMPRIETLIRSWDNTDDEEYLSARDTLSVDKLTSPSGSQSTTSIQTLVAQTPVFERLDKKQGFSLSSSEFSYESQIAEASQFAQGDVHAGRQFQTTIHSDPQRAGETPHQDIEKLPLAELFSKYFEKRDALHLQRTTYNFIHSYEAIALFPLEGIMRDGCRRGDFDVSDNSIYYYIKGFEEGRSYTNQQAIAETLSGMNILMKQQNNIMEEQQTGLETIHQNVDALQKTIQRQINELSKLMDVPLLITQTIKEEIQKAVSAIPVNKGLKPSLSGVLPSSPTVAETVSPFIYKVGAVTIFLHPETDRSARRLQAAPGDKGKLGPYSLIINFLKTADLSVLKQLIGQDLTLKALPTE